MFSYYRWDHTHWRERAEEARAMAECLGDPESMRMMLRIAEGYDRIADRAENIEKRVYAEQQDAAVSLAG